MKIEAFSRETITVKPYINNGRLKELMDNSAVDTHSIILERNVMQVM